MHLRSILYCSNQSIGRRKVELFESNEQKLNYCIGWRLLALIRESIRGLSDEPIADCAQFGGTESGGTNVSILSENIKAFKAFTKTKNHKGMK